MGWTIYQVSNFTLSAEIRSSVRAWNDGKLQSGGALPAGLALINWGLVRFVGLSVLKWASVSSSPSPCAFAWLPCCNSSSFSGFLSHIAFHSQRNHLKRKCLLPSPLTEVTLWAMMWRRRNQWQHPHMHLTGLMFHNCTQKVCHRKQSI